jgi:Peptidase family M23
MQSKHQKWFFSSILLLTLLINISPLAHAAPVQTPSATPAKAQGAPAPFMHRPYYGSQTVIQRTISFFDHDRPWYDHDGVFVRYDGLRWTNSDLTACTPRVNCYDGHNGYDLDMNFEPVLSSAAGTVIRAGWYNPTNHNDAFGLWAAVDHKNGLATAYGHLSALTVTNGDAVGVQWQLGTSGTTGSSTGPHLHFGTYYLNNIAWQPTDPFGWRGTDPDPNIVADNYLWSDKPATSGTVPNLSANGSAVYPGATVINDGDKGWGSTGNWTRATAPSDNKGDLHWTYTSASTPTATATWQPTIPKDGYYEIGVFVDDNYASSSWVPYTVYSADPARKGAQISHAVYVDESHTGSFQGAFGSITTGPQWISIGTYYFKAGTAARVVMSNATGETGQQIAADAVEFVPVP